MDASIITILAAVISIAVALFSLIQYIKKKFFVTFGLNQTYLSVESHLSELINSSKNRIDIIGVTLWNIFGRQESSLYKSLIRAFIERNVHVRILIYDPKSDIKVKAKDITYYTDHGKLAQENTIKNYLKLKEEIPDANIELRICKLYRPYSFMLIDNTVYIAERHQPNAIQRSFVLSKSKNIHNELLKQFEELWDSAIPV